MTGLVRSSPVLDASLAPIAIAKCLFINHNLSHHQTVSLLYTDLKLTMPEPITKVKACDAMVVSLSGLVNDYNWQHDPASPVVCILTEDSFLVKKTELEKLQEKVAKLEEANAYANKVLKRSQFYAHMGRGMVSHLPI